MQMQHTKNLNPERFERKGKETAETAVHDC